MYWEWENAGSESAAIALPFVPNHEKFLRAFPVPFRSAQWLTPSA